MSANYFYLFGSLPLLQADAAPPLSSAEFLDYVSYHLSPEELRQLTATALVPHDRPTTATEAAWYAWETAARNLLVRHRAGQLHRDPQEFLHDETDAFAGLDGQIADAMNRPDPLQREQTLDNLRWRVLGDLEAAHPYSFEGLVVYRLKLLLLEKHAGLDAAAGRRQLDDFDKMQTQHVDTPELAHAE